MNTFTINSIEDENKFLSSHLSWEGYILECFVLTPCTHRIGEGRVRVLVEGRNMGRLSENEVYNEDSSSI